MKITPEFIPHEQFHLGKWMVSVKRPSWYYFQKCRNTNDITNEDFSESVDMPLRRLVGFLHNRGIKTTPSCSGHHKREKNFKKIYAALEKDAAEITGKGLELKEIETGRKFIFQNKNYRLPWTRKKFIADVKNYQSRGILGMRVNNHPEIKNQLLQLKIKGVRVEEKNSVVLFFINKGNGEHRRLWKKITAGVKKIFSQVQFPRQRRIVSLWKSFWRN